VSQAPVGSAERRALQAIVVVCALLPVTAGMLGALFGAATLTGDALTTSGDSHFRYLSGLLLGIGLAFLSCVPSIEAKSARFGLLTAVVFTGGLARLYGVASVGAPSGAMLLGLAMELVVTPLLCLWQLRVARAARP